MSNDYFNHSANVISNGTRATAAQVNNIAYEVGGGLDKLPTEAHIKRGTINYAADTGSANLYAVSLPYPPASYTDGMEVVFKAANSNTGACSMNVNSLGVKSIKRADGTDPAASEIPANKITTLRYNSTSAVFEIQNGAGYASSAAASATAAANSAASALVSEGNASASETAAGLSETAAGISAAAAAASAATIPAYPALSGNALRYLRLASGETSMEFRTAAQTISDLGISATSAELSYSAGVTSNIQTQLNAITSGTGTLSATAVSNIDSISTSPTCTYLRVGSIVFFAGRISSFNQTTSGTESVFSLTVPVASNFTATQDGHAVVSFEDGSTGYMEANAAGDYMVAHCTAKSTGGTSGSFSGSYVVK